MPRLFLGLSLPESVAEGLVRMGGGIPGARWETEDKLHLTLRFLGEMDHGHMRRVQEALGTLAAPTFEVTLRGVGHFPPRGQPRSIWIGVEDNPRLLALKRRVDRIVDRLGVAPDRRKFVPHVTLARLRNSPRPRVADFEAHHGLVHVPPFRADCVRLFSSVRSSVGSKYRVEAAFPLIP